MKKKPEEKIDEDWMSTYGDMVTLLLCFFVMMLSVSKPDVAKYEQISAGLSEGLGKKIIQRPIEMLMTELNDDIQSLDLEKKVAIGSDTQGIVLEFGGDMLFNRGSADIKPEALPALKRMAATLQSDRYKNFVFSIERSVQEQLSVFSIEGHTSDEKVASEKYPSNWELSSARASAVARFLEERGIARVRMRATGMNDVSPKYPNLDPFGDPIPENRIRNRRVVIHIEPSFM